MITSDEFFHIMEDLYNGQSLDKYNLSEKSIFASTGFSKTSNIQAVKQAAECHSKCLAFILDILRPMYEKSYGKVDSSSPRVFREVIDSSRSLTNKICNILDRSIEFNVVKLPETNEVVSICVGSDLSKIIKEPSYIYWNIPETSDYYCELGLEKETKDKCKTNPNLHLLSNPHPTFTLVISKNYLRVNAIEINKNEINVLINPKNQLVFFDGEPSRRLRALSDIVMWAQPAFALNRYIDMDTLVNIQIDYPEELRNSVPGQHTNTVNQIFVDSTFLANRTDYVRIPVSLADNNFGNTLSKCPHSIGNIAPVIDMSSRKFSKYQIIPSLTEGLFSLVKTEKQLYTRKQTAETRTFRQDVFSSIGNFTSSLILLAEMDLKFPYTRHMDKLICNALDIYYSFEYDNHAIDPSFLSKVFDYYDKTAPSKITAALTLATKDDQNIEFINELSKAVYNGSEYHDQFKVNGFRRGALEILTHRKQKLCSLRSTGLTEINFKEFLRFLANIEDTGSEKTMPIKDIIRPNRAESIVRANFLPNLPLLDLVDRKLPQLASESRYSVRYSDIENVPVLVNEIFSLSYESVMILNGLSSLTSYADILGWLPIAEMHLKDTIIQKLLSKYPLHKDDSACNLDLVISIYFHYITTIVEHLADYQSTK